MQRVFHDSGGSEKVIDIVETGGGGGGSYVCKWGKKIYIYTHTHTHTHTHHLRCIFKTKIRSCPEYGEVFTDLPTGKWTQCFQCKLLFHESGTEYIGKDKCICITCM